MPFVHIDLVSGIGLYIAGLLVSDASLYNIHVMTVVELIRDGYASCKVLSTEPSS